MDTQVSNFNITRVRIFTALASFLLSLQAVYFDDIINRDGIMYLQQVEAYLTGGLASAKLIYDWPVFSIIVAWVHKITTLPIEAAGFLTNSLLFIILTDAIILISGLLVKSQRQLIIAAVLVLCFIPINEYRDFILRDPGYWAFSSLALYHFMIFVLSPSYKAASLWQVFIIIAVLFRIEGAVVLFALPFFLFFLNPITVAISLFLQSLYLAFSAAVITVLFMASQTDLSDAFGKLGSISSFINIDRYEHLLNKYSTIIEQQILNQYSGDYATLILISGLFAMLAYKLLKTFSISYLIIYFVASSKTVSAHQPKLQRLLLYFFFVNIFILSMFLFKEYFVSSRYAVLALISLLLLVMYPLCHGIEHLFLSKKKMLLSIVGLCLFYNIADTTTLSSSKTYIKETALWAAHHLPDNSLVMTDDEFMLYYFNREKPASTLCVKKIYQQTDFLTEYNHKMPYLDGPCSEENSYEYQSYDYVIVVEKERHPKLIAFLKTLELERIFYQENERLNDGASVYKVIK
jgi:hypothetical protein